MKSKIYLFILLISVIILSGCNNQSNNQNIDEKYYCESQDGCADGEYCEVTEPNGCVSTEWWWKNIGNKFDCKPKTNTCKCINNKCERN